MLRRGLYTISKTGLTSTDTKNARMGKSVRKVIKTDFLENDIVKCGIKPKPHETILIFTFDFEYGPVLIQNLPISWLMLFRSEVKQNNILI